MPEPLPLTELLAVLKERGLPIGVREHLAVGRLLSRWDDTDAGSLQVAVAAVLARNPGEVRLVRETFEELYGAPEKPVEEAGPREPPPPSPARRPPVSWRPAAAWLAAALALALVVGAWLWPEPQRPDPPPVDPEVAVPQEAPEPPRIPDTFRSPDWQRSLASASGVAAGLFLWLYGVRFRRQARRRARDLWSEQADALPGPYGYELSPEGLAPPFPSAVLDDAAGILGRRTSVPPRSGDIDVDRTLARTLRAGLAPHVVFRSRASSPPILVLEDVGGEMRPWRRQVSALLSGLEARGVPLDRWRFHADAGRVFRPGHPGLTLKQLYRLRAESPLLVLSVGEGILEGGEGRAAVWVDTLRGWRYAAWLHPVTDSGYWSPALRRLPVRVWPMTPEGLLAAARQAARGELGRPARESARAFPDRPVVPLDVDRLRWLLALAPRRTPELGELLRQRFCPDVPPAALQEALEAPPPAVPLNVGPSPEEVHTFLAGLLDASEPPAGTAAHERWRLDRALQQLRVPDRGDEAARELTEISRGPLAGEVERAVEELAARRPGPDPPIPAHGARYLRRTILQPLRRRAGREGAAGRGKGLGWRRPQLGEIAAALLVAAALGASLPELSASFQRERPVDLETVYRLELRDPDRRGSFDLVTQGAGGNLPPARLIRIGRDRRQTEFANFYFGAPLTLEEERREGWFYVRSESLGEGRRLAVSNLIWVPAPEPPEQQPQKPLPNPEQRTTSGSAKNKRAPTPRPVDDTAETRDDATPPEDNLQIRLKELEGRLDRIEAFLDGSPGDSGSDLESQEEREMIRYSASLVRRRLQDVRDEPDLSAVQDIEYDISALEDRVEELRRRSSPAQQVPTGQSVIPSIPAEAQQNIEWCIRDAGAADCPGEYEQTYPECLGSGNRSCLLGKAIDLAKRGECEEAYRLTLICQCHNPNARKSIEAAGRDAVCDYLRSKGEAAP